MSGLYAVGFALALVLALYLFVALFEPERFG